MFVYTSFVQEIANTAFAIGVFIAASRNWPLGVTTILERITLFLQTGLKVCCVFPHPHSHTKTLKDSCHLEASDSPKVAF